MSLTSPVNTPVALNGLILSGGKSSRMGQNKATLNYHGIAQSEYQADLLADYCAQVLISVSSQSSFSTTNFECLPDIEPYNGPMIGVASAFRYNPDIAWLVLACDLPYLNAETIALLVESRNPKKAATCFYNSEIESPEPLIAIYEPKVFSHLNTFVQQKNYSLRKLLLSIDVELLEIEDEIRIKNSNTPAEKEDALRFINDQS